MTHLPFIVASYGLTIGIIVWLSVDCILRTRRARARLAAIDPREKR